MHIPNYATKCIYWEYFLDKLRGKGQIEIDNEELRRAIRGMAFEGEIQSFLSYFQGFIRTLSNRDLISFDEKHLKVLLMTIFSLSGTYIVNSEYEVETGYIDIFFTKNKAYAKYIQYEWIIEVRYIKERERSRVNAIEGEAIEQLKRYWESERLKKCFEMSRMKKAVILVVGKKDVYAKMVE